MAESFEFIYKPEKIDEKTNKLYEAHYSLSKESSKRRNGFENIRIGKKYFDSLKEFCNIVGENNVVLIFTSGNYHYRLCVSKHIYEYVKDTPEHKAGTKIEVYPISLAADTSLRDIGPQKQPYPDHQKLLKNKFYEDFEDVIAINSRAGKILKRVVVHDPNEYKKLKSSIIEKQETVNNDLLQITKDDPNNALKNEIANAAATNFSKDIYNDALKMKEFIMEDYMIKRIREYFSNFKGVRRLNEDFSLHIEDIISPSSISKWRDAPAREVIEAAKKKNRSAVEFIFYKMRNVIAKKLWNDYLGPNRGVALRRLRNGADQEWLSIAWQVLTGGFAASKTAYGKDRSEIGTIDQFDIDKVQDPDKLWNAFSYIYANKLHLAAKDVGESEQRTGITGVGEDGISTSDISKFSGKNEDSRFEYQDRSTEDKALYNVSMGDFISNWKSFVQDKELNTKKSNNVSYANAFATILENPEETNLKNLAEKIGLARMTFKTYVEKAIEIMDEYGIDQEDLFNGLKKFGSSKIASYLDRI